MTIDEILFRASCCGDLMVESRDGQITELQLEKIQDLLQKKRIKPLTDNQEKELARLIEKRDNPELSETCKKRLIKVFASEILGRSEDVTSKYLEKGTLVEEDSITLYSRVKKVAFKKNTERFYNKFTQGMPDIYEGETIQESEHITDIKSSWSLITFLNAKVDKKLNHDYEWQGHTYHGLLPKAKLYTVAYCLVNSPAKFILDEKRKIQFAMGFMDPMMADADEAYREQCKKIERNHIFEMDLFIKHNPGFDFHHDVNEWKFDIPKEKRVHEFTFGRNEIKISALYKRVPECRKYMKENL